MTKTKLYNLRQSLKFMNKTKCLVTGGAGFIGSHLVDKLLELGYEVRVIDDFSSGKQENLEHHKANPNLKIFNRSICDRNIGDLFKDISVVFHVAALPRVQFSIDFPEKTNEVNINGTLNVLEMAKKSGVKRFVYSASSSAYGNQEKLPLIETMTPNPMSPYALQKLVGEYYCKLYNLLFNMETICLRYFNVFGSRQNPSGGYANLIPKSINLVLQDKSPQINGDGEQTRDFTYVKDVIASNILAAKTEDKRVFGEVFNIGNGKNISVNNLIKMIIKDKKINPEYKSPVIEPKDTLADNTKAKNLLKWSPQFTFEKSIEETIDWFKKNK